MIFAPLSSFKCVHWSLSRENHNSLPFPAHVLFLELWMVQVSKLKMNEGNLGSQLEARDLRVQCLWLVFLAQNTIGYRYLVFQLFFFWSNLILTSICKRAGMPPFLCVSTLVSKSASMTKKNISTLFQDSDTISWSKTVTFLGKWVN